VKTIPTPVDDLALIVWAELADAGDDGLAKWEIRKRVPQLSKYQIDRGLDRINHVLQEVNERPIVHFRERRRGEVYRLPDFCPDYKTFALRRLKELVTRAHTELVRAQAATLKWPNSLAVYLPKMMRRTIEDIEDMMLELEQGDDDEQR